MTSTLTARAVSASAWRAAAADRARARHAPLLDLVDQRAVFIAHRTRSEPEMIVSGFERVAAPFGHGPAVHARPVKADIQRAMIERVFPPGPGVIGREDAADECDQDEGKPSVLAEGVGVEPAIPAGRNRGVEAKSVKIERAAVRPDSIEVGTPGPGCVPPPAR